MDLEEKKGQNMMPHKINLYSMLVGAIGVSMISVQSLACELDHGHASTLGSPKAMLASAADSRSLDGKGRGSAASTAASTAAKKDLAAPADAKEKLGASKKELKDTSPGDQRSLAQQVEILRKDIDELKRAMETKTAEKSTSTRTDVSQELNALQARLQELAAEIERSSDSSVATAKGKFKELLRDVGKDIESLGQGLQEKAK